ncbi:unnamed protein product [Gordionus sp. m RMFG-2023]
MIDSNFYNNLERAPTEEFLLDNKGLNRLQNVNWLEAIQEILKKKNLDMGRESKRRYYTDKLSPYDPPVKPRGLFCGFKICQLRKK